MKDNHTFTPKKGFLSLIGLLLSIVIIFVLCYFLLTVYLKGPSTDKATKKSLTEQNIDTTTYQTTLDSTKARIKNINKELLSRQSVIGNTH